MHNTEKKMAIMSEKKFLHWLKYQIMIRRYEKPVLTSRYQLIIIII